MSPPYNKLTYYSAGTPNGLKPAIVLEELGLTYETKAINIVSGQPDVFCHSHVVHDHFPVGAWRDVPDRAPTGSF
jgi:hypothetical protein